MSSLYLHIPFCRQRCPYCDFFSQVADLSQQQAYVAQLQKHLQLIRRDLLRPVPLQTVYFGGGTPSLLRISEIDALLTASDRLFGLAADCEITLEANPGTITASYLAQLRQTGVNRLSLGIQTFAARQLQMLGRCHSREQGLQSIAAARAAGFDNLSLDLIFALPDQTLDTLEADVDLLLRQQPEHISVYGLTFEEGTAFEQRRQRGDLVPCSEDEYARQYEYLQQRLCSVGYEHYELSNFALPQRRCRHNQVYWQRRTCLAAGCGAHAFSDEGFGERWAIPPDPQRFAAALAAGKNPAQCLERFTRSGAMQETLYLALRTADGLDRQAFAERFGQPVEEVFAGALQQLGTAALMTPTRIALRPQSWLIYDHLVSAFLG